VVEAIHALKVSLKNNPPNFADGEFIPTKSNPPNEEIGKKDLHPQTVNREKSENA